MNISVNNLTELNKTAVTFLNEYMAVIDQKEDEWDRQKQQNNTKIYWLGIVALISWITVIVLMTKDYWLGKTDSTKCQYCHQYCRNQCTSRILLSRMGQKRRHEHWLSEWRNQRRFSSQNSISDRENNNNNNGQFSDDSTSAEKTTVL